MITKTLFILLPTIIFANDALLLERIENLEKEVKTLNIYKENSLKEREDLEEIVEKVETKSILDKINFSPELQLRVDKMDYKVGDITGEETKIYGGKYDGQYRRKEYSKDFDIATSVRFRLNMSAAFDDNVKFNGRLVFANSSQSNQRLCILSRDIKSASAPSAFDVDRAYFDYLINGNSEYAFTFTFGLLPTTGGTPMQYAQNDKRKSMFPALVFNMNSYGLIATQKLKEKTYLRAIFAKAYTMHSSYYSYQCNRENIDNADIMGLYLDSKFNFLGKALVSGGFNYLNNLKAHPYLGPDVSTNNANVLGSMTTLGLGMDIRDFADTKTTLFIHSAMSLPDGNNKIDDYQIVENANQSLADGLTESGDIGFSEAEYAKGSMVDSSGYALYIGMKHDITKAINFGLEYNYGSQYWFSATQGAEDIYNKLATRGHVGEAYVIWNFHAHIFSKLGYLYTKEEYTGSGWHFAKPVNKDGTQKVAYLSINARF